MILSHGGVVIDSLSEDKLIYEMVDPNEEVHIMLWMTETVSGPDKYLMKMADMKGLTVTGDPIRITAGSHDGWVIRAEGKINDISSTVIIASFPLTGEKYVHHKNHIAQYIMQAWCPSDMFKDKATEIGTIQRSLKIF